MLKPPAKNLGKKVSAKSIYCMELTQRLKFQNDLTQLVSLKSQETLQNKFILLHFEKFKLQTKLFISRIGLCKS